MTLNVSVEREVDIYLGPLGLPFFTSVKELFHTLYRNIKLVHDTGMMGGEQYFLLQREQWSALSRPEQPCETKGWE